MPPAQRLRGPVLVALFAGLTALGAFVRIPLPTGVPFTLQIPAVLLAGCALGPLRGAASQLTYLACGLAGLPVFAAGGGPGYLLSPTFGFLAGFVAGAAVAGLAVPRPGTSSTPRLLAGLGGGLAVIYLVGVPWLLLNLRLVQGKEVPPALVRSFVAVYLPLDIVKAALLVPLVRGLHRRGLLLHPR